MTYDITDENSFKNIKNWIKQIEQNAQNNVCKVLVGNKCDMDQRKISFEQGAQLAKDYNMKFFETSAKTSYNVNEVFTFLTREILNDNEAKTSSSGPLKLEAKTDADPKKQKKECCK